MAFTLAFLRVFLEGWEVALSSSPSATSQGSIPLAAWARAAPWCWSSSSGAGASATQSGAGKHHESSR